MRTTGTYTTYSGETRVVAYQEGDGFTLYAPGDRDRLAETVPLAELGDVVHVVVEATWRGGRVTVSHERGADQVTFVTQDRALAEREQLSGDQYAGWGGVASVDELEDVQESAQVIFPGGRA